MSGINLIELSPNVNYFHHPQHRDGTWLKSQWTIDYREEEICFVNSHDKNWILNDVGWGLHFVNGSTVDYLGTSHDNQRDLFIAKFTQNQQQLYWHGYPADYQVHIQDIPDETVLDKWLKDKILTPSKVSRIAKGKVCRL